MSSLEQDIYFWLCLTGLLIAGGVFLLLFWIPAPYGRYIRPGWGPSLPSRAGWVIMEFHSLTAFLVFFLLGNRFTLGPVWIPVLLWGVHYANRTFVFPFRLQESGKRIPVLVVAFGVVFNVYNGYLNGRYLGVYFDRYTTEWLLEPRFLAGLALFAVGMTINLRSDNTLMALRRAKSNGGSYKIPYGGAYRWVSCPNYLGEMLEWIGWALVAWSMAGFVFVAWTAANLIPRAYAHHQWYRRTFPDYPPERKAFIPFLF